MKTKKSDVLYCGVDEYKIQNASPGIDTEMFKELVQMVKDRYRIHKRKDVQGKPKPWTKNPIMQQYKFTNVRREHDRQSKYLIDSIVNNPELTLEDKIVNCFMFRAWNNWSTLRDFGFPYSAQEIYHPKLKDQIRDIFVQLDANEPDRRWWSSAYNQGGTKCAWKFADADQSDRLYKFGDDKKLSDDEWPDYEPIIALRPFHVGVWIGRQNIVEKILKAKDQQECFEVIRSVRGFAYFLAYQVFVDLTYIKEFPFSENEFTVAGPGCRKGLDLLFIDRTGLTYEECLFWLRDSWETLCGDLQIPWDADKLFSDLPEYDRCMNVMSLENCFCEFSKYMRAKTGQGKPKVKYKGV